MRLFRQIASGDIKRVVKNRIRRQIILTRSRSSRARALPDFIIVGVQRGGSSTLFNFIAQHPHIHRPLNKETHFFTRDFARGERWYRSYFPKIAEIKPGQVTGEATPNYIFYPHSLNRIKTMLPEVKLIVTLRNPVYRAISHYTFSRKVGVETLPISEAMAGEEHRIKSDYQRVLQEPGYLGYEHRHFSYKTRGIYVDQLEKLYALFDPSQILVIKSEDIFEGRREVLAQIFTFIGVSPHFDGLELRRINRLKVNYPLPDNLIQDLHQFFIPHNQRLYQFLGRDFNW